MIKFKIIPDVDKNEFIISFAQTVIGKLVLLLIFYVGILDVSHKEFIILSLLIITLFSYLRRYLLAITGISVIFFNPIFDLNVLKSTYLGEISYKPIDHIPEVFSVLLFFYSAYYLVNKYSHFLPFKYPVISFLLFIISLMCISSYTPLPPTIKLYLWIFIIVLTAYCWHFSYSLINIKNKNTSSLPIQSGHYFSIWGGSTTPYAKGSVYLRKIEAKNSRELAITQLKGIKLIYWSKVLLLFKITLYTFSYGQIQSPKIISIIDQLNLKNWYFFIFNNSFNIIKIKDIFISYINNTPYGIGQAWSSIVIHFSICLLTLTISGHVIISICRMAGFRAMRNTYKPFAAHSIADFWNRYYYYFKELLVDVFFYPAFLRFFKKKPKLRIFFATFSAAGIGNFIYHYLCEIENIIKVGPWQALIDFKYYLSYATLLALGISFSQVSSMNKKKHEPQNLLKINILKPIRIFSFFIIIFTYHELGPYCSETLRLQFFLYLIGLR